MTLRTARAAAVALACGLCAAPPVLAGPPSFDCAAARSKVEKAICASPALSDLDRRMASAYAAALKGLDDAGKAALRTDQRIFIDARNAFFGTRDYDLKADLADRAAWLERIDLAPRTGWDGLWGSVMGEITLAGGGAKAEISTVALTQSHPVCMLEASARPDGSALLVGAAPADIKANEGWTVRLARSGATLTAELLPPKGGDGAGGPPFCGNIPSIGGAFLPLR